MNFYETILCTVASSIIIYLLGWILTKNKITIIHEEKFKNIEKSNIKYEKDQEELEKRMRTQEQSSVLFKTYDNRILKVENDLTRFVLDKMTIANSPLKLTLYAQQLFKDIGFDDIFAEIKDELIQKVNQYNPRTKYDVQEFSRYVLYENRNLPILDNFKKAVFEKGKNLDEVIAGAFIPLRDYYLEKHPEISD